MRRTLAGRLIHGALTEKRSLLVRVATNCRKHLDESSLATGVTVSLVSEWLGLGTISLGLILTWALSLLYLV